MGSRHAFWVILAGASPTAFRSPRRADLLPTLHQLQRTQKDVTLQWFDRGRLWASPDEARAALLARRRRGRTTPNKDWRPGGTHQDPRARYKQSRAEKRRRWKQRSTRPPRTGQQPGGQKSEPGRRPPRQHARKRRGPGRRDRNR